MTPKKKLLIVYAKEDDTVDMNADIHKVTGKDRFDLDILRLNPHNSVDKRMLDKGYAGKNVLLERPWTDVKINMQYVNEKVIPALKEYEGRYSMKILFKR